MQHLSARGQQVVSDLAQRHGFSPDAVEHMLVAVLNGNGSMAQFNHPEFAGSGQWMQGGMLMIGDMFNQGLSGRVDALCNDISATLAAEPGLLQSGSFQSQSQGGGAAQTQRAGAHPSPSSLFVPDPEQEWWPAELGQPDATGSQDQTAYAFFFGAHRLAVKTPGQVWVYNTLDHNIGGFSQQQGGGGSILFTSQYGMVDLASLPVVSINGQTQGGTPPAAPAPALGPAAAPAPTAGEVGAPSGPAGGDVFAAIERLGQLHQQGLLTDQEFSDKKTELLGRL